MTADAAFSICATCAVEHAGRPEVCAICADERQWVPAGGQRWTTLGELAVGFMRSYPNHLPLSAAVTERVAVHIERLAFDRLYGNFTNVIDSDARAVVRRSAARHVAWVRGDHDHLT